MRAFLVLLLTVLLLLPQSALAGEPQAVRAVFGGEPSVVERIVAVLRPSLQEHGLSLAATRTAKVDAHDAVKVTRTTPADAPVAYLWLDLNAKPPTLILVEAKSRLVYAQSLKVSADPDDVETELIRFVVDQSLGAILSGNAPTVTATEFERSLPPPVAEPGPTEEAPARPSGAAPQERRWLFSAGYSLRSLGSDALEHGPEMGLELRFSHVQLKLHALQRLPLQVTREQASVRLISSGIRLLAASALPLGGGLSASIGAGVGLDATRVSPTATGAVQPFWVSDPLLLGQLALEQNWGAVQLAAYGGVEWAWVAARYTIQHSASGSETVWVPARVRPCAGLSFGYAF